MTDDTRTLAVDRRQERALGGSIGEGSKESTDGIHVSGQPGITIGITIGHEAQGDTAQPGTKQASDKPAGDSKLGGVKKQRTTRGCTCWASRSVERALGGGRNTGTGSYTNATNRLPRYPGVPSKGLGWSLEQRICLDQTERLGEAQRPWTPAVCGVVSPRGPMLIPYLCPYSCQGEGEPRGDCPTELSWRRRHGW